MKRETQLIHSGRPRRDDDLVNPPIQRGSTVLSPSMEELYAPTPPRRHYGRGGLSPNLELREAIAGLYKADHVSLTPSGLSSIAYAIRCAIEKPGQALITDSAYKPVRRFCQEELPRLGIEPVFYDPRIGAGISDLINEHTQMILLESPGSLTLEVQDIPAIAGEAQKAGVKTVIDDTWTAGLLMNPLDMGVDFAAQALTKYVGGHSDFLMGAIAARGKNARALEQRSTLYGLHVSPDDAFLALRGLRTLPLRIERSGQSGLELASRLVKHPKIARVIHPALKSSPDHGLFARDFDGACGCFSVILNGFNQNDGDRFAECLKLFGIGFSWGGFESLVLGCDRQLERTAVPWKAEGALIRFSIGLEHVDDLWTDIEQALDRL